MRELKGALDEVDPVLPEEMTVEEPSMPEVAPPGETGRKRPAEEVEEGPTQEASQSTQEALGQVGMHA
eukprot:12002263-Karenia_brevis.AAC.1